MNPPQNLRRRKKTPAQMGAENQSIVFAAFGDEIKLTIKDAVEVVKANGHELSERTVRRAIDALEDAGFLISTGRRGTAILYTKQSTSSVNPSNGIIPLNGELVSVEKFLRFIAENDEPFKLKHTVVTEKTTLDLRKTLLFAIITAGEAGHNPKLKSANATIQAYLNELTYAAKLLQGFIDSPVWYANYRDRIAIGVRDTQKNDPNLVQLCYDIIKGG